MNNSKSATWRKGSIMALLACLILAGAIGWRFFSQGGLVSDLWSDGPAEISGTSEALAMSTPFSLDDLRESAEAAPDDSEAWQRLAFAYFSSNMFPEAVDAFEHAAQNAPEVAVLWSSLGEARVMASEDDPLPEAALEAFRRALEVDPRDPRARYFLAVERDLSSDHEGAIADWLALLADTQPGAPWESSLVRTIEQVGTLHDIEVSERIAQASATRNILPAPVMSSVPGPTADQLASASSINPSEQQNMAESMVARLAARMETEPGNIDGWIMLMRSYKTLGRDADATSALRRSLEKNPQAGEQLRAAAEELGV